MVAKTKENPADKKKEDETKDEDNKPIRALTEEDIRVMQAYGAGPYTSKIKKLETELKDLSKKVNEIAGIKESDTGLAHPSRWDLVSDKQMMQEEAPLSVSLAVGQKIRSLLIFLPQDQTTLQSDLSLDRLRCLYFSPHLFLFSISTGLSLHQNHQSQH